MRTGSSKCATCWVRRICCFLIIREQFLHPLRSIDARAEATLQILSKLQGLVEVAVPEMPLQALELLLHRGRVQLAFLLVARS